MKKMFLIPLLAAAVFPLGAYDLQTKALTPVKLEKAEEHAPFKLVENGKLKFAVVTEKNAETNPKTEKSIAPAVDVIVAGFEKCTGQKPEVFDLSELDRAAAYPYWIIVGDNRLTRERGIDVSKIPDQGFTVRSFAKGIVIAGSDSSLIPGYNSDPMDSMTSSQGTLYGAYDFTERVLGMRYFLPGESGTYAPETTELEIKPFRWSDAPYFRSRGHGWYLYCSVKNEEMLKKWEPYLGKLKQGDNSFGKAWRMGSSGAGGGAHCPRPEKLAAAYPDKLRTIFYTSPTGKFWYNPKQHIGNYYNVFDLKFADLLMESYQKYYETKKDVFGFGEQVNNTFVSFGVCDTYMPTSEILNDPTVREFNLITKADLPGPKAGEISSDAAMRNIYARFYQYLGNRVKKELPGKKLFILAYYNTKCASVDPRWKLPDNIEIWLCPEGLPLKARNEAEMRENERLFREWYTALGNRPVRKVWLYNSRNNPFARAVSGEFVGDVPKKLGAYMSRDGGMFFDLDGAGDYWHNYYANYAACRSEWNPEFDVDAAIDEHWNLYYGPKAGPHLKEFHRILKQAYLDYCVPSSDAMPVYPPTVIDKLDKLLREAEKNLTPGSVEMRRFRLLADPWPKHFATMRSRLAYECPVYPVHRLLSSEKIVPDGNAGEPVWSRIAAMPLLNPKTGEKNPKFPTEVKLAWDDTGIYGLAVSGFDPEADPKRDVWGNCGLEILLMPGLKKEVKYQIAFDVTGQRFSAMERLLPIPQPVDLSWQPEGFQEKTRIADGKWVSEFYLPFAPFGKAPELYDSWNCNLVRNKKNAPAETTGNSLTLGNNHNTAMYGMLKFMGKGE